MTEKRSVILLVVSCAICVTFPQMSAAQNLPGSADPARIEIPRNTRVPTTASTGLARITPEMDTPIPENAKTTTLTLKKISLDGTTAFSKDALQTLYKQHLNKDITLDIIWKIAADITRHYHDNGYFLSRAYVPAQEIEDGQVKINIVEGYVADIKVDEQAIERKTLFKKLCARIVEKKPLNIRDLESFMLRMNALPGKTFDALVEPMKNAPEGGVRLSLHALKKQPQGSVNIDNAGSRFLGPYQATLTYQDSFIPFQETTLSTLNSVPTDELSFAGIRHAVPFYPDWQLYFSGSYASASPGASLRANDINSTAVDLGFGVDWQPVRQRQKNIVMSFEISGKNTNGDILDDNPLIRDRIRALRARINYETNDPWNGYNMTSLGVNKGIRILDASRSGAANLSRAEADPDFVSAQFNYTRQQHLSPEFVGVGQLTAQIASGPLFSAEEFGFGGLRFGRAYDPSEFTGDHGLAGSIELRYVGLRPRGRILFYPYAFYDVGSVWNDDTGGTQESASSAGFGMRVNTLSGLSGNVGMAVPLTREAQNPVYGNGDNPRLLLQLGHGF